MCVKGGNMKKFLVFNDGHKYELSPISYDEFMFMDNWRGTSDTAFDKFLKMFNWRELEDFNEDALKEARIELVDENGRILNKEEYEVDEWE
jgi:hypothetical protein